MAGPTEFSNWLIDRIARSCASYKHYLINVADEHVEFVVIGRDRY